MPTDTLGTLTRLVLDSHIGAQSLIREIRIFVGMNNALLEEIVGYNVNCIKPLHFKGFIPGQI